MLGPDHTEYPAVGHGEEAHKLKAYL